MAKKAHLNTLGYLEGPRLARWAQWGFGLVTLEQVVKPGLWQGRKLAPVGM